MNIITVPLCTEEGKAATTLNKNNAGLGIRSGSKSVTHNMWIVVTIYIVAHLLFACHTRCKGKRTQTKYPRLSYLTKQSEGKKRLQTRKKGSEIEMIKVCLTCRWLFYCHNLCVSVCVYESSRFFSKSGSAKRFCVRCNRKTLFVCGIKCEA